MPYVVPNVQVIDKEAVKKFPKTDPQNGACEVAQSGIVCSAEKSGVILPGLVAA